MAGLLVRLLWSHPGGGYVPVQRGHEREAGGTKRWPGYQQLHPGECNATVPTHATAVTSSAPVTPCSTISHRIAPLQTNHVCICLLQVLVFFTWVVRGVADTVSMWDAVERVASFATQVGAERRSWLVHARHLLLRCRQLASNALTTKHMHA